MPIKKFSVVAQTPAPAPVDENNTEVTFGDLDLPDPMFGDQDSVDFTETVDVESSVEDEDDEETHTFPTQSEPESEQASTDEDKYEGLICFFSDLNPEPSDEQVHALAFALGVPKEQLEERIYALNSRLIHDSDLESEVAEVEETDESEEPMDPASIEESFTDPVDDPLLNPKTDDDLLMTDGIPRMGPDA